MILSDGGQEIEINMISNGPLAEDLLLKFGCEEMEIYTAKQSPHRQLKVKNLDKLLPELSAWGIPWKRIKWNGIT